MTVFISVTRAETAETYPSGKVNFVVTLSETSLQTITVDFRTLADGSAFAGVDFTGTAGTLTFNPGELQKTISVTSRHDNLNESDENFSLELFDPVGAQLVGGEPTIKVTGAILDDDGAVNDLALFVSDPTILEGDSGTKKAVFEVTLSRPASNDITLSYKTANGTAKAGEDFKAKSGTITFKAGQTLATVEVDVFGDLDVETDEQFSLVVTPNGFIQNGTADSTGVATIRDTDTSALPVLSVTSAETVELYPSGAVDFVVTLSKSSLQTITVDYRTLADGSALSGVDFTSAAATLTFNPGETQKTIRVVSRHDNLDESDENFSLELFDPTGATLAGGEASLKATGVILDDDGAANDLALFVTDPTIVEGDSGTKKAVFEVTLSRPAALDITLDYTTVDGTAKAGQDYSKKTGSITFKAGQTLATVEVDVRGDTNVETDETFSLVVTPTGSIQNGTADSTGTATIKDTDTSDLPVMSVTRGETVELYPSGSVAFVVTLSESSLQTITVDYRTVADGSAFQGVDFTGVENTLTFNPGETQKTIFVSTRHDGANESDENFSIELFDPKGAALAGGEPTLKATGSILDDDGAANDLALFVSDPTLLEGSKGSKKAVFEIELSQPSGSDIVLDYMTVDGSAKAGKDYKAVSGQVTFKAGQTKAMVEVDVLGDTKVETDENFSLVVTPNGFIQNGTADSTGIATIRDTDSSTNEPVISIVPHDSVELYPSGKVGFVITLSEPALQTVTVDYRTIADGSALSNVDFTSATGTVTFNPGDTQQVVYVTTSHDGLDESDENFSLELYSPQGGVLAGGEPTLKATGIIFDDDGAANDLSLFVTDPTILEGNFGKKTAVFEVELSRPLGNDITLDYTTVDGTAKAGEDYNATSGKVTFKAGQTVASIEVDVLGDTDVELDESFSLVVTPNGFIQNGTADSTGVATIKNTDREGDDSSETINGTIFGESLLGLGGDDLLYGLGGEDVLLGGDGKDTLFGGTENDRLFGDDSNDTLNGGSGDDSLFGGANNDTLIGGLGNDRMDGGKGIDTATYISGSVGVSVSLDTKKYQTIAGFGKDKLVNIENLEGTDFDDVLTSSRKNNTVFGADGNDKIKGLAGNDKLNGEDGDDTLIGDTGLDKLDGGKGNDTLNGGKQQDKLYGGKGNDDVSGGSGADKAYGGAGKDNVSGGNGDDVLNGDKGNDVLSGGRGDDIINGGAGNDRMVGGKGDDQFTGGSGIDTFIFQAAKGASIVNDFDLLRDLIDFTDVSSISNFRDVMKAASDGSNPMTADNASATGVNITLSKKSSVYLEGVFENDLTADMFIF